MDDYSHVILVTGARTFDDAASMKHAFSSAWRRWGPTTVTRPLLVSGNCPDGADALAERLWAQAGFELTLFPADWKQFGKRAGFMRNQQMVDHVLKLQTAGAQVLCTAFLDLCLKSTCRDLENQQLLDSASLPGHFSHGTVHCRQAALDAGLEVLDTVHPDLPPF